MDEKIIAGFMAIALHSMKLEGDKLKTDKAMDEFMWLYSRCLARVERSKEPGTGDNR